MKIALVISSLRGGGAERVLSTLAGALHSVGHEVLVVTESGVHHDHYRLADGVKRIALDVEWQTESLASKLNANLRRLRRLRAALKSAQADRVIAFGETTNIRTLMSCVGAGTPIVVSERVDPRGHRIPRAWDWLRRRFYPGAAAVVVQTESVAQWARSFIDPARVHVIPNPVHMQAAGGPRPELLPEGKVVLAMGRLTEQKGFPLLIDAFARSRLGSTGWNLGILGEGPDRNALEAQVRECGLQEKVRLPGLMAAPEQWLRNADLFVLSSRYEGFPNALLEAMACGVAPIAFDCPSGPSDIIRHGKTGLLLPAANVEALSDALCELAGDPKRRRELGEAAREDVGARFALSAVVRRWEDLLSSAHCGKGRECRRG